MEQQQITPASQPAAAPTAEPEYAALVAIDWADKKHYWALITPGGKPERGILENTPEAVEAWAVELSARFGDRPIALALEQRKGALVAMLSKYKDIHLFPVHPRTLAKFRQALYPSGSKDDRKDTDLLLEILSKHRAHLRRLDPDTTEMRLLQFQVENRRKLVDERTALGQRLLSAVKVYFPQIARWFTEVSSELVCDLLSQWPTLEDLQKVRPARLEKFLREHRWSDDEKIQKRIAQIRQSIPATADRAVIGSSRVLVAAWIG